jgi:hypothetical protein
MSTRIETIKNNSVNISKLTASVRQLDDLQEKDNIISDMKRQKEQAHSDIPQNDEAIKELGMKLNVRRTAETSRGSQMLQTCTVTPRGRKNPILCVKITVLEENMRSGKETSATNKE